MTGLWWTLVFLLTWIAPTIAMAQRTQVSEEWQQDAEGRAFRVGFDPGSRLVLGAGYVARLDFAEPVEHLAYVDVGTHHRYLVNFEDEGIAWKIYSSYMDGRMLFDETGLVQPILTVFQGRFMRWAKDGQIVLPTSPPKTLSFPLNIGFEVSLGSAEYADLPTGFALDLEVARMQALLDVWHTANLGSYAQFGVGPAYEVGIVGGGGRETPNQVEHRIAPFTSASFTFHHTGAGGRHVVDAHVRGGAKRTSGLGWGGDVAARVSYEAVLLAVNDVPVSLYSRAQYRYQHFAGPHTTGNILQTGLGFRVGAPLSDAR